MFHTRCVDRVKDVEDIVFVRAAEDNRLNGVFFRGFEWFETGFGHGVIICVMD